MKISIFKSILIGVLLGALVFIAFKLVVILLLVAAIFKLSGAGKWKNGQWRAHKLAYIDTVRNMNEDEYKNFRANFGQAHGCGQTHYHSSKC